MSGTYDAHGVRLDVYLKDEHRTKHDIEMQATTQSHLEERIRYYTGGIDRTGLDVEEPYEEITGRTKGGLGEGLRVRH